MVLTLLVGMPCAGKSTYAQTHFAPHDIVSLDFCSALVGANETGGAWEAKSLFWHLLEGRTRLGRSSAIDATCLTAPTRARVRELASAHGMAVRAVMLECSLETALFRNRQRRTPLPEDELRACHRKAVRARADLYDEPYELVTVLCS